ncbi:hypothetical protein [Neoroseomonas oryzicola]|uniref:Uncharacterized protein n=1 Tax=Neoroseomonas oryzicola TaxID=535904 RepID=A0A9X9WFN6_9PROT|nr:hypothetical protein [Neoroseomonas oryzicola]MBR0659146.1 hypothetical protein [Neoroseomonas oryzicola]NKE17718.1 hypothetical protein [Neoroseomonas oryzicola]
MRVLRSAAAALALAACAPARAPEPLTTADLRRAGSVGEVLVLARFHRTDTGEGIFVGGPTASVPAFLTRLEDGREERFGGSAPSVPAAAAGWVIQPLRPGAYHLTLGGYGAPEDGRAFLVTVPSGGGVTYIGSIGFDCPYTVDRPCRRLAAPVEEPLAARPALPGTSGAQQVSLARRHEAREATRGWPPPSRIEVAVDRASVRSAIDWEDLVGREGSREVIRAAGGIGGLGVAGAQGGSAGAILMAPVFAVALVTVAVGGIAAGAEAAHRSAVEHQWRPCLDALGEGVPASAIEARIPPATWDEAGSGGRQRSRPTVAWQVEVTRVVLRRCPGEGLAYGAEVGMRWTTPGREAHITRAMRYPPSAPGLRFQVPPVWELPVTEGVTCRPLADYCRPEGAGLLAADVADAVAAARDVLLQPR